MELDCQVCFDTYPIDQILTLSCDHKFCEFCLKVLNTSEIITIKKYQFTNLKIGRVGI